MQVRQKEAKSKYAVCPLKQNILPLSQTGRENQLIGSSAIGKSDFILWLHSYVQGSQTCRMGMSLGKSMEGWMLQMMWSCGAVNAKLTKSRHHAQLLITSNITMPSLSHSKAARIRLGGFPGLQFSLSHGKLLRSFLALRFSSGPRTRLLDIAVRYRHQSWETPNSNQMLWAKVPQPLHLLWQTIQGCIGRLPHLMAKSCEPWVLLEQFTSMLTSGSITMTTVIWCHAQLAWREGCHSSSCSTGRGALEPRCSSWPKACCAATSSCFFSHSNHVKNQQEIWSFWVANTLTIAHLAEAQRLRWNSYHIPESWDFFVTKYTIGLLKA